MFIDTSGWLCIFDERDLRHDTAVKTYMDAARLVTHNYVLAEFIALCNSRRKNRPAFLKFADYLLDDSNIEVFWVDDVLNDRALELLRSRSDKMWSLCDAVSFVLMSDLGIAQALTTDHDFEQAGFVKLLEP